MTLCHKIGKKMGFLAGKRILVTGIASNRSIAYGIAKAMQREGAELAFTYQNERLKGRVEKFAKQLGAKIVEFPVMLPTDEAIETCFSELATHWDGLDGLVCIPLPLHPKNNWKAVYVDNTTRERFKHCPRHQCL